MLEIIHHPEKPSRSPGVGKAEVAGGRPATTMRWIRHIAPQLRRHLTYSAVKGPTYPPLCTKTLSEYWTNDILSEHGARPALICREEKLGAHGGPQVQNAAGTAHLAWNFDEFNTSINATARGLLAMGVQPGDRVAVVMGNNRYFPTVFFIPNNPIVL